MSDDREPFFTPAEWKALVPFRPRAWREWWDSEPLITKVLVAVFAILTGWGMREVSIGNTEVGWTLIALTGGLIVLVAVVIPLACVPIATVRWLLRKVGAVAVWRKVRKDVLSAGKVIFWLGLIAFMLVAFWPYLSLDPVKSWYALTRKVPVERIQQERVPHDCEFATAPIGSKHCHYDATIIVFKGDGSPDGQRSLLITYERVED